MTGSLKASLPPSCSSLPRQRGTRPHFSSPSLRRCSVPVSTGDRSTICLAALFAKAGHDAARDAGYALSTLQHATSKSGRLRRNPFHFGDVVTGQHFTHRTSELKELVRDLRSGQSVLIISARRYGKTSLITAVLERLRTQHTLVAYVDLLRTTTKERFANQ
jgi:hypothetical protein